MEDKSKGILDLENYKFIYSIGMQKKQVESSNIFLIYVAARYRKSVRASLLANEVAVTKVDEDIISKFDIEDQEKAHLARLKYQEKSCITVLSKIMPSSAA